MGCNQKGHLPVGLEKRILISREITCTQFLHSLLAMSSLSLSSSTSTPHALLQCRIWKCTPQVYTPPESSVYQPAIPPSPRLTRKDFTDVIYTYTYHSDDNNNDNNNNNNDGDIYLTSIVNEWSKGNNENDTHHSDSNNDYNNSNDDIWCPLMIEMRYIYTSSTSNVSQMWPTDLPFDDDTLLRTRPSAAAQTIPDNHNNSDKNNNDDNNNNNNNNNSVKKGRMNVSSSTSSLIPSNVKSLQDALKLPPIPIAKSYLMGHSTRHKQSHKAAGITGRFIHTYIYIYIYVYMIILHVYTNVCMYVCMYV